MKKITLFICAIFLTMAGYSQDCSNTSSYGSANVSTPGIKTISTCNYLSEYSIISGVNAGYEYEFTGQVNSSSALAYITVRTGSFDGAVVASGISPLTITAPTSENLYAHWNVDAACATLSSCSTTTVVCVTCSTIVDCEGVSGGSALPGTACDDGDAGTINDVYDADCNCAGVAPAAGSVCDSAIPVVCNADPTTYPSAASNGTNTTTCAMGNKGLWFSFMGTGADITVNSTATFDHEMSINTGACGALVNVGCRDNSSAAETYTIAASEAGEMYFVYIAHWNTGNATTGDITISLVCAAVPECTAPTLALAVQDVAGDAITDCLDAGGEYYVLATLSGGDGNTSYNVSANSGDAVEVNADGSVVLGPFTVGTNVSVTAVGAQDGDCDVSATATSPSVCPPSNDDCDGAIALQCGVTISGSTANATASGLSATCDGFASPSARDVFYSFEADGTSSYLVSLNAATGNTFDGILFVYSGACGSLTSLGCSDSGNPEEMELTAPAAGTYIVRIFRYTLTGDFTLGLTCTAPPECTAPSLALEVQDVAGDAITDCLDSGEEYYVLATLSGGTGNTSYNVSANGGAAVEVAADDSAVFGPFTLGTNVTVTAVGAQDGDCDVSATATSPAICPPSNDDCGGAIALQCGVTITGSTANATASGLSATCGIYTSSSALDLFYSFEADGTSSYVVSLNAASGVSFDGILFVYSGACGSLTSLGCSDSGNPEEIELTAPAAGTYIVRIFKYSGAGEFTLDLECTTLSINENNTLADARLFPNPLNDGTFYIYAPQLNGERVEVNITDVAGRQIFNNTLVGSDNKVTVSVNDALTSGLYLVTLKHAGETHTFRLVKE